MPSKHMGQACLPVDISTPLHSGWAEEYHVPSKHMILWAEFNKVSTNARSMSKAHRSEVFNDHMRDLNWKKLVGMGKQYTIVAMGRCKLDNLW